MNEYLVYIEAALIAIFVIFPQVPTFLSDVLSKTPVAGGMFKALGAGGRLPPRKKT